MTTFPSGIPVPSRQNIVGQGVVSAAGVCKITFNPPPLGYTLTGTVSVYDSPTAASWQIALSGTIIDISSGASSVGNIQIQGADVLTLTASNLLPFAGQTFHANFTALSQEDAYVTPIIPSHDSLVLPSTYDSTVLVPKTTVNGNGSGTAGFTINGISIATKYIKVYWTSVNVIDTAVIFTGASGIIYSTVPFIETFGPITAPQGGFVDVYIESALDTTVTVTFPQLTTGQALTVWVAGSPISPLAHIDDGQIVLTYDLNGGIADTPTSVTTTAAGGAGIQIVPAPPAGKLQRVGTVTFFNTTAAAQVAQISAAGAGTLLIDVEVSPTGTVAAAFAIPFDAQVSTALNLIASAAGVVGNTYYRTINAL